MKTSAFWIICSFIITAGCSGSEELNDRSIGSVAETSGVDADSSEIEVNSAESSSQNAPILPPLGRAVVLTSILDLECNATYDGQLVYQT